MSGSIIRGVALTVSSSCLIILLPTATYYWLRYSAEDCCCSPVAAFAGIGSFAEPAASSTSPASGPCCGSAGTAPASSVTWAVVRGTGSAAATEGLVPR